MTLAIIFDSVGAGEWLVLLAVLLVVMGPKRLPSTARTIGAYYSKFRRAAESFKRQLMDMDYEMEREIDKARREAEAAMTVPDDPPEFHEGEGEVGRDVDYDFPEGGPDDEPAAGPDSPADAPDGGGADVSATDAEGDNGDKPPQEP